MIGKKIDKYEIVEQIGSGGMGEVYRARDEKLDRDVAVKVLPSSVAGNEDRLRRFEQEARSTSALNHPNIVTVYEIREEGEHRFLVTELIEGQTLRELMEKGATQYGMQTFDGHLLDLYKRGDITLEAAQAAATSPGDLMQALNFGDDAPAYEETSSEEMLELE